MNIMRFAKISSLALLVGLAACSQVPPGYVGVRVELYGGDKGIDSTELPVGRYWIGVNEQLFTFPTFMQNYTWTKSPTEGRASDESFTFQTVDGMSVNADIGISYQIRPDKVTSIFQTYRRGVEEITDTFLRNMVRDALVAEASGKPIEYVYGAGKAELIKKVQQDVVDQVDKIGITVDKIYWIGDIRLPQIVIDSINNKTRASQMAEQRQNEIAQTEAEAKKAVAQAEGEARSLLVVAQAQAQANKLIADSITPNLVAYKAIEKWLGATPGTLMVGQGATPSMLLSPSAIESTAITPGK